tara:strand:+ start:160 stop:435 length:276 start_codon:yes stop_codon:yes gene_type:complete
MKLTKQKLINIIKEEVGKVTEGHDGNAPLSEEAEDLIVDSIHAMLRQLEDMGFSRSKHYWTIQNVITDDAIDSYSHPDKESWAEPGGSEDF